MKTLKETSNVYTVIKDTLTKCDVVKQRLIEGGKFMYYVKVQGVEEPIAIEQGTKFYKNEEEFRCGVYIEEPNAKVCSKYTTNFVEENGRCYLDMWYFNGGEPEKAKVEVNEFIVDGYRQVTPVVSNEIEDNYYTYRGGCLAHNDYTVEEDGVKRVVKSIAKRVKLEEDQLQMVEELKKLIDKLDENGVKVITDWSDSQVYVMNTRHLKDIQSDCETPALYSERDMVDYDWLEKRADIKLDVICSDSDWRYYTKVKD